MAAILEYWYHSRNIQYAITICTKCLQLYSTGLIFISYQKYQHWWIESGLCPSPFGHIIAEWQPSWKMAATLWECNVPLIFKNASHSVYYSYQVLFTNAISTIRDWTRLLWFTYWPILFTGGDLGKWLPWPPQYQARMPPVFKMTFMVSSMIVPSFMLLS